MYIYFTKHIHKVYILQIYVYICAISKQWNDYLWLINVKPQKLRDVTTKNIFYGRN